MKKIIVFLAVMALSPSAFADPPDWPPQQVPETCFDFGGWQPCWRPWQFADWKNPVKGSYGRTPGEEGEDKGNKGGN